MKKIFLILCITLLFTGCNSQKNKIVNVNVKQDLIIDKDDITETATFYNYEVDGVVIQLFAVKATDGSIRILFNTCSSCNPAPNSYFIQKGKYFICGNCKNKYTADEIGLKETHGCSPVPVLDKKEKNGKITISWELIEKQKDKFKKINHYKG